MHATWVRARAHTNKPVMINTQVKWLSMRVLIECTRKTGIHSRFGACEHEVRINELYRTLKMFINYNSSYLLYHANGQMHMNVVAPSGKIINKHSIFVMYQFKSATVVSCLDLYLFLGYYLPI